MIVTRGLTKRYGKTVAVDGLSFTVPSGVVTGFLGPNGSGKSTTMRMIMGLDVPDAGAATVNGLLYDELRWPLREVGALLDAKAFHPGRTARQHLRWLAKSNEIPEGRIDEVLDIVGLTSVADQRAGKFSLGMGQRLGIAGALLGDPGVLLFDEPVNGLDPEGIRWARYLLRDMAADGRTVLVSSHLISEMALTAERLVVIGRGTLIAETSVEEFSRAAPGRGRARRHPDAPAPGLRAVEGRGAPRCVGGRRHRRHRRALRPDRGDRRPGVPHPVRAHADPGLARGRLHGAHIRLGRVPLARPRARPGPLIDHRPRKDSL